MSPSHSLETIPSEMLFLIGSYAGPANCLNLMLTSRYFYNTLDHEIHRVAASDPRGIYYFLCYAIIRNLPGALDNLLSHGANTQPPTHLHKPRKWTPPEIPNYLQAGLSHTPVLPWVTSQIQELLNTPVEFVVHPITSRRQIDKVTKYCVETYRENEYDVNKQYRRQIQYGYLSLVFLAGVHGRIECARVLLKHGVEVDLTLDLVQAVAYDRTLEVISLLIESGADPSDRWLAGTKDERSPLMIAAGNRYEATVRFLMGKGADASWAMKALNSTGIDGEPDDEGARWLCEIRYPWKPALVVHVGSRNLEELRKAARESSLSAEAAKKAR